MLTWLIFFRMLAICLLVSSSERGRPGETETAGEVTRSLLVCWGASWHLSLYWPSGLLVFRASASCCGFKSCRLVCSSRKMAVMRNLSLTRLAGVRAAPPCPPDTWISMVAWEPGPRLPVLGRTLYFSGEVVLIL